MIGGLDHDVATGRRSPLPQPEVLENLLDDRGRLDHRDQPHLAAAAAAPQNVLVPHPAQKIGPRETASAPWIVWAGQVVVVGRVVVLELLRIYRRRGSSPSAHRPVAGAAVTVPALAASSCWGSRTSGDGPAEAPR